MVMVCQAISDMVCGSLVKTAPKENRRCLFSLSGLLLSLCLSLGRYRAWSVPQKPSIQLYIDPFFSSAPLLLVAAEHFWKWISLQMQLI